MTRAAFFNNYENHTLFIHKKIFPTPSDQFPTLSDQFQTLSDQFHQSAFETIRRDGSKLRKRNKHRDLSTECEKTHSQITGNKI